MRKIRHGTSMRRRGAAGQQYAIIVGLIAVVAIAAIASTGSTVRALFTRTSNVLTGVGNGTFDSGAGGGGGSGGGGSSAIAIVTSGSSRTFADGATPTSCAGYFTPASGYAYSGATGDGVYSIRPTGQASAFQVYCNMTDNGGGWTLVMKQAGGDGTTLQGTATYWTSSSAGVLNDITSNQNLTNTNLVSRAFTTMPVTSGLMLKAANETSERTQAGSYGSAFAAFAAPTAYADDCNATKPNWAVYATTYPSNEAITSARFAFNFTEMYQSTNYCGARWGWSANQNGCDPALAGSHDVCGGLGGYGFNYGTTYMQNNRAIWNQVAFYLYAK